MPRATFFKFIDESARECKECNLMFDYPYQMRKHNKQTHEHVDTPQGKYRCSWPGCSYSSSQSSNLNTHYRTHTQEKSKVCPDCNFKTCDPSSLTRHRKRMHNYVPIPRKGRTSSSDTKSVSPASTDASFQSIIDFPSSTLPVLSSTSSPTFDLSSLSSSALELQSSLNSLDLDSCNQIPLDFDDLFNQRDPFYGTRLNWNEDSSRLPCPRPLFPAVDTTASLQKFNDTLQSRSESWPDLSLLLGNLSSSEVAPCPDIYSSSFQSSYNIPSFELPICPEMHTPYSQSSFDNSWQSMDGVASSQSCNQATHCLQPISFDSYNTCVPRLGPSIAGVISPEDFQLIFQGTGHDNTFLEQDAAGIAGDSSWGDASFVKPASEACDLPQTLFSESSGLSNEPFSSLSMDSLFAY